MMVLEKQKFYVPILCQKRGFAERVKMKVVCLPPFDGHRTGDEWLSEESQMAICV